MSGETYGCIGKASESANTSFDSNAIVIVDTINKDSCYKYFTEMSKSDGKKQQQDMVTHHVVDEGPLNMNVSETKVISKSPVDSKYNCCLVREIKHDIDEETVEAIDKAIRDSYFAMISTDSVKLGNIQYGEDVPETIKTKDNSIGRNNRNGAYLDGMPGIISVNSDTETDYITTDKTTGVDMFGTEFRGMIDNTATNANIIDIDGETSNIIADETAETSNIIVDETTGVDMFGTEFNEPKDNTEPNSDVADIVRTADGISYVADTIVGTTTDNIQPTEINGELAVGGHLCKLCGESFKTSYYLTKHRRIHTGQERPHACQLCDKRFTERGQLRKHLRIHTGTKPYKCTVCQKQFTQSHNLKRHILIHTGEQPYQCSICSQSFTCASNTKRHVLLKHPEDVDSKKVSIPAAPDKGTAALETILESLIKRNIPKQNSLKELKFGSKVDIPVEESEEIYMEKRQPKTKQEKICVICDREFKKTSHLKDHMRRHTGQRPFICHICGKGSTVRSALNKHLRVHSGERPFKCEVCQKGFTSTSDRDAHQQLHYKERAYQCGLCNAQFVKPYLLMRHMASIHRAERPYKCDLCAKAFKTNSHLSAHKRTHGVRKKKCELCGKEFKYFTDLAKHKQIHTEQEIPYDFQVFGQIDLSKQCRSKSDCS